MHPRILITLTGVFLAAVILPQSAPAGAEDRPGAARFTEVGKAALAPFPPERSGGQSVSGSRVTETLIKSWPVSEKRFAVLIAVDNYADSRINSRKGAPGDARLLAEGLVKYAGFPSDHVLLFAPGEPQGRRPTRSEILCGLTWLAARMPQDSLLLIYFGGHGMEKGGEAFLLPYDVATDGDVELLQQTALNLKVMQDRIHTASVGQVMLILDVHGNAPQGRPDSDNLLSPAYASSFNLRNRSRALKGFILLYATNINERAYDDRATGHGYFTETLIEAISGAAAKEDGRVTLSSLSRYMQTELPQHVARDLGPKIRQRPLIVSDGYSADEVVLLERAAK